MESEIFSQGDIQSKMQNMAFIQLDMTNNTDDQLNLLNQFGLFGPPAVLFFKDGKEITSLRITGEVEKETFSEKLEQAAKM